MFTRLQPILYVENLAAEAEFYRRLGFETVFESDTFVGLSYGEGILFGLEHKPGHGPLTEQPLLWQIGTDDIEAVHQRCKSEGIEILVPPRLEEWGDLTMQVCSPNGYHVTFEGEREP